MTILNPNIPLFDVDYPDDAWALLKQRFTAERLERMCQTAAGRTLALRLVVQDVHQPHNVSACLRSADAFGVQMVDIVTEQQKFKPSTVTRGVHKWLSWRTYDTVADCAVRLKNEGYALAAGYPDHDAVPLDRLPLDRPLAIVFGNEHDGVSDAWAPHLDHKFTIPMVGMVESLNISVSCAITLFTLRQRLEEQSESFLLSEEQQAKLLNAWAINGVSKPELALEMLRKKL